MHSLIQGQIRESVFESFIITVFLIIFFIEALPTMIWDFFMSDSELNNPNAFDIPANKVPWWFI